MNMTRYAFASAFLLIIGVTGQGGTSFAADSSKEPAGPQPGAKPDMCDHDYRHGMMGGEMGGMMGGHGDGMMMKSSRHHLVMSLDLNDGQRAKIGKLSDELRRGNWATKGLIMDESAKLRELYQADKRDPAVIGKQYQKIFDLQRQMIEATIAAQNRIEELLTPDQRAELKKMHRKNMPMR